MKELKILFFLLAGFLAEFIDGSLGMCYGVSLATFFFFVGFLPAITSATIHLAEIFTSGASALSHIKFENVRKDIVLPMIVPGCIGGGLGAYGIASIPGQQAKPWVALILLAFGIIIFSKFLLSTKRDLEDKPILKRNLGILAFVAAFCDACTGGGWGPICTPSIILSNKSEPRKVIGSIDFSEFPITLVISIVFIVTLEMEGYYWIMVFALAVGGIIAAPLAAYTVRRIPARLLGILVGISLILVNLKVLLAM